jgi:hypothetical protein
MTLFYFIFGKKNKEILIAYKKNNMRFFVNDLNNS